VLSKYQTRPPRSVDLPLPTFLSFFLHTSMLHQLPSFIRIAHLIPNTPCHVPRIQSRKSLRTTQTDIMTSYFSRLSPIPSFPEYTGPHKVGTIDVELPVSEFECPSASPDESISTVQYRIFYPCDPNSKGKAINWIPSPQRGYVSAYTKFLGAGSLLADFVS
jgi:hypothetical protein